MKLIAFSDGGCKRTGADTGGINGESVCGVVLYNNQGELATLSMPLGIGTNNTAEYQGAVYALTMAHALGATDLKLFMDSQLVVNQVKGVYSVTNENLKWLHKRVMELSTKFNSFHIEHVYREQNKRADELANLAYKSKEEK